MNCIVITTQGYIRGWW